GEQFEDINIGLTKTTDLAGASMQAMQQHAQSVAGALDTTISKVGSDMGVLSSRLRMEAGGALDELTQHVETLRDRWGQLDVQHLSADFVKFGISGADAAKTLASFNESARSTGTDLNTIVSTINSFGDTLREIGLNSEQAAALIGKIEQAGIPA